VAITEAHIEDAVARGSAERPFSGVVLVALGGETLHARGHGHANRAESIPNTIDTRFGMASGCKTFTAVAVCRLVEEGLLDFDTRLADCLDVKFPNFDPGVTIHHLLTHTSGVPDYFDEEVMEDFEVLWKERPVYTIRSPRDLLPIFREGAMKFTPGERFSYSNAGYILLGLVIEEKTGASFSATIEEHVLARAGMPDSGYFAMDALPSRTALGYIDGESGSWRTNVFSIPAAGMPDGGAFTTAPDMAKFWRALGANELLSPSVTERMLSPHVRAETHGDDVLYGHGVWLKKSGDTVTRIVVLGEDPGVSFVSCLFPERELQVTVIGNTAEGAWPVYRAIVDLAEAEADGQEAA